MVFFMMSDAVVFMIGKWYYFGKEIGFMVLRSSLDVEIVAGSSGGWKNE